MTTWSATDVGINRACSRLVRQVFRPPKLRPTRAQRACRLCRAGFTNATSEIAFDTRTDITFTTAAAPEPSTVTLLISGCVIGLVTLHRQAVFRHYRNR